MTFTSLEEKLLAVGSAVEMARNSQIGPYVYPAVPAEFSNWRDEQVAWRETSALFDQSHHMLDLQIEGPGTIALLSHVGVNSFEGFVPGKAKQLVACNDDGRRLVLAAPCLNGLCKRCGDRFQEISRERPALFLDAYVRTGRVAKCGALRAGMAGQRRIQ